MARDVFDLLLFTAESAFLQVGVFVGGMLLIFGLINYRTRGGFVRALGRNRAWQPVFGALLGLTPGCGGAIFVMPLFVRGMVSFGTVVATLASTAGDSAFVLIAAEPAYAAICYAGCFAVGVVTGYAVDLAGIGRKLSYIEPKHEQATAAHAEIERGLEAPAGLEDEALLSRELTHIGHVEGDAVDMAIHHRRRPAAARLGRWITHRGHIAYWAIIAVGLALGIVLLFQIDVNTLLGVPHLGAVVGIAGTVFSILLMIAGHTFIRDDTLEEQEHKLYSLRETLAHSAGDTAFATTWVFAAYFIYELFVFGLGGGDHPRGEEEMHRLMLSAGVAAVFVGALVGLIPGCGPQIIFVALFAKGLLPFSALFANAVSQDGDALFPLIAMSHRSAFWATVVTTIPALIFGLLLYYSGVDAWIRELLPIAVP